MEVRLGDHVHLRNGSGPPARSTSGRYPVYGANGVIGYAAEHNAKGPLIVVGRVGSYCGSLHYCESDVWVTDNALVCRAQNPEETRYWYYALQTCRLNEQRAGSGQPLLNQRVLRDVSVWSVAPRDRPRVAELLGALDDKIAANERVIRAAEAIMVAAIESIADYVPLSCLASRSAALLNPGDFDDVVAHFSFPAFDQGGRPQVVGAESIRSAKFHLSQPCVLFSKLNPRVPRIWNVVCLPAEMAVASTEFVALTPACSDTSALWSALRQHDVSAALQQLVAGTSGSHQRIQLGDLLDVRIKDVRKLGRAATETLTSLGALCHARRIQCAGLSGYRDALLPPLMSGGVQI